MKPIVELSNIHETFERVAARYPHKAAVFYLGTAFSYAKINRLKDRFASGLLRQGLVPGDKIILYLPNSVHWVVAWLGALKAGLVVCPITPMYTPFDLQYIANDTGAKAVVCTDRNYGYVIRVMEATQLKTVVVSNMADLLPLYKRLFGWLFDKVPRGKAGQGGHSINLTKLLDSGTESVASHPAAPDDLAEILYTGGTTKHPKGVPITHRVVVERAHEQISTCASLFPLDENVILGSAPVFHILGQTTGLGTILVHGGTVILAPRVNLDALMDDVARHRVTTLIGVPTLFRMILEHDRLDLYDLSSLRYCFSGGDVLPQDLAERWQQKFKYPIYIGYGATETVGGVSMSPPDCDLPPGAMGKVMASKEIRIIDPLTMQSAPIGQAGEILVHSDPMVKEYWNKPEETAKAFIELDGKVFYRTADVVKIDEQGFLYFVDRTMDTIKHKGYRVSASEIESVLQDHAAVIAACVVGVPDDKVGERIKAFVVLKKDIKGVTGHDLTRFCRQRLAGYKVPQYIEFRDMLPKSKVGKLLRRELRAEEMSRLK
ncbi:MAG: acyl--CoA ligase [Deltaproteobacteria bacterium]|nr:acyl--CoA ligase [Deltaproteobacteria bacterium]